MFSLLTKSKKKLGTGNKVKTDKLAKLDDLKSVLYRAKDTKLVEQIYRITGCKCNVKF